MILADSSVWIDHLRSPDRDLQMVIGQGLLLMHPFVLAELAMGSIPRRAELIEALQAFPQTPVVPDQDLLDFVDEHDLFGTGLGMVDGHLLASTSQTAGARLWARDKKLVSHAERLGLAFAP